MKQIINGKKYDTETAECVAEHTNNLPENDFNYCDEYLYRKTTGEFFLYGKGGPLSKYAVSCGNGWTSGKEILPLTDSEAKAWVESFDNDEYETLFGEVAE